LYDSFELLPIPWLLIGYISPEVTAWLEEKAALDPTADEAEALLVAYAIVERLHRLQAGRTGEVDSLVAPEEIRQPPPPRLARALELILRGTYPGVLPEAITILNERKLLLPPHLLPELLEEAGKQLSSHPDYAQQLLLAGGHRASWLTTQNPAWAELCATPHLVVVRHCSVVGVQPIPSLPG